MCDGRSMEVRERQKEGSGQNLLGLLRKFTVLGKVVSDQRMGQQRVEGREVEKQHVSAEVGKVKSCPYPSGLVTGGQVAGEGPQESPHQLLEVDQGLDTVLDLTVQTRALDGDVPRVSNSGQVCVYLQASRAWLSQYYGSCYWVGCGFGEGWCVGP